MPQYCRYDCYSLLRISGVLGVLMLAGCGQKVYEERLQESRLFYEYLQTIEEALAKAPWKRPDLGMSMRVPKPFSVTMPGPAVHKDKEGELVTGPDPREKNSLGAPLPGLMEAWECALDSPDGQPNAWIYLLTNHSRFRDVDQGGPSPDDFLTDLEHELMRLFQVTIPEGETSRIGDNVRYRQWIPTQNSARARYTSPKDYTVIRFVPDAEYNSADLQATVYERKVGKIQVALVFLTRKSTSAAFRQRVGVALETFDVDEVFLPRNRPAAAPGTAETPSTGTPSSGAPAPRSSNPGF